MKVDRIDGSLVTAPGGKATAAPIDGFILYFTTRFTRRTEELHNNQTIEKEEDHSGGKNDQAAAPLWPGGRFPRLLLFLVLWFAEFDWSHKSQT